MVDGAWRNLWPATGSKYLDSNSDQSFTALEFLIYCQSAGVTPTISASNKLALQGEATGWFPGQFQGDVKGLQVGQAPNLLGGAGRRGTPPARTYGPIWAKSAVMARKRSRPNPTTSGQGYCYRDKQWMHVLAPLCCIKADLAQN